MLAPFKTLQNEVLRVTSNVLPLGLMKLNVLLADVLVDFLDVSAIEWSKSREKLVRNNT